MGLKVSKNKIARQQSQNLNITSFSAIKIPDYYQMIKLCSININLRNSIHSEQKVSNLIEYIGENYKEKEIDILCIQGIHDYSSLRYVYEIINTYNPKLFFVPIIHTEKKNKPNKNIIISKYPIISTVTERISSKDHDIGGYQTVVVANILIENNIISVYNTELAKNIKHAKLTNTNLRKKELKRLFNIVNKNKELLHTPNYDSYTINDIHFIVGSLNINDIDDTNHDILNEEFRTFIEKYKCIDIFRYKHKYINGYTTKSNERHDYIMLHADITEAPDGNIFKIIHKNNKLHFIDIGVRGNIGETFPNLQNSNYPIELIFILQILPS